MLSADILSITTFVYALAAIFYIVSWIYKKDLIGNVATYITIFGVIGNTLGIILRWIESYQIGFGHAPFSNMYESLIFFSLTIAVIYLFIEFKYKNRIIGSFTMLLTFLVIAYASFSTNKAISPLIPALQSNWLIAHVITCFLGYAAFAIAFCISILYLLKAKDDNKNSLLSTLPKIGILDELTYQMVAFGFLFLTVGIITGSVWANSAWGSYWTWDPKETWSLITWFLYATLLHARFVRNWHGKKIAWLSIIGFMAVLFTYFGVNYLPGLHSYGAG